VNTLKNSSPPIHIRLATEDDVAAIRKVIRSAIEGLAARDYPPEVIKSWGPDTAQAREKQKEAIRTHSEITWVAIFDDQIVGFAALAPKQKKLRAVYVAAEASRLGIGSALLKCVETKAKELGLDELSMHSSLTAVPFYEHHGYAKNGETLHTLASGDQMKAVAMEKHFEVEKRKD